MCLSVPARVVGVSGAKADVEVYDERRQVYLACRDVRIGDWVLLYGGMALCVLEPEAAKETVRLLAKGTSYAGMLKGG